MPINGDCIVTAPGIMLDGRNSTGSLVVRLGSDEALKFGDNSGPYIAAERQGTYSFAAGTLIESGSLVVTYPLAPNLLVSDVEIRKPGALLIQGSVSGAILNHGRLEIWGTQTGLVTNHGTTVLGGNAGKTWLTPTYTPTLGFDNQGILAVQTGAWDYGSPSVAGDLRQSAFGVLRVSLATGATQLSVSGRALLDGELQIVPYTDAWGPYPLPGSGSYSILVANEGVVGQFARWTAPGLFVEGSLRYGSNEVWFDLTRMATQAAMAGQGFGGITLASAGNLDRALGVADGYAALPRTALAANQQRFLQSAGRLLWQSDAAQAARSLDSLAGHGHAQLAQAQSALVSQAGAEIARRALRVQPGGAGTWSANAAYSGANAAIDGYDRWLGPNVLVGSSISHGADALGFTQLGGHASGQDRLASLYLHHRGERWQATAVAVAGRSQRLLQRTIDLGDGRHHLATSQRSLSRAGLNGELARPVALAGGTLQPFVGMHYAALRSARFSESGDTGFELVASDAFQQQLSAAIGARYARQGRLGNGWLGLHADWQLQHPLVRFGEMPVAFVGVPQVLFDLDALDPVRSAHFTRLGLDGGFGAAWRWSLQTMRSDGGRGSSAWQLRFARDL